MNKAMLDLKKWWFAVKIALQIKINDTAPTNGYTGCTQVVEGCWGV
jgi:hypothetical protein